jgi:hypothetical protein
MNNRNIQTITLPRSAFRKREGVVVLPLEKWQRIEDERRELCLAFQAVLSGELALREKRTRTFRQFLKSELSQYAKNL